MKWEGQRQSDNVEDRRDDSGDGGGGGFGGLGGRSIGIGTIVLALVGGLVFHVNPLTILGLLSGGGGVPVQHGAPPRPAAAARAHTPEEERMKAFVSTVLADTEDVFRARMVAQVCYIEDYRRSIARAEGRELSSEEAAGEWIAKYASKFPGASGGLQ